MLAPHRLLVVDDDPAIQLAMQDYFTSQGYAVECASTQEEAETLLAGGHFAVVITDLSLHGAYNRDGLAVVDYVRAHCAGTRLMLLTAHGSAALEHQARARGVDVFLYKPQPLAAVAHILGLLLRPAL